MSRVTELVHGLDPVELWRAAMLVEADEWQAEILRSTHQRLIINVTRQGGKSSVVAVKALHTALYEPQSLILLVSRSLRQSLELARKVFGAYQALGRPVDPEAETKLTLELSNGSRIVALPGGDEGSIRGFSGVRLLIMDEAARCPDALWIALRPMVAVSGGDIILLSTPFGKRGFFHQVWAEGRRWQKFQVTAHEITRLDREFLEEERRELGERWFAQEYLCAFVESIGQVFADAALDAAFGHDVAPLFEDDEGDEAGLADFPALFGEEG